MTKYIEPLVASFIGAKKTLSCSCLFELEVY